MNDFRKEMHVAYKKNLANIIWRFLFSIQENDKEFEKDPRPFIEKWINSNCLPMGDFSKEDAIKEIEGWSNGK